MDLGYRAVQFWQLLTSQPLSQEAWLEIEGILSPSEADLFRKHTLADRRHSYRTMRLLRESGHDHRPLLAAALLHDIGKTSHRPGIWERVVGTVVEALCPRCILNWGVGPARGWRRPFVIRARHAEWGASLAQEAGSSPLTVKLIRYHQDKGLQMEEERETRSLQLLQWADDQT